MSAPQHWKPEADYVSAPCTKPQLLHRAADKKQEATKNLQQSQRPPTSLLLPWQQPLPLQLLLLPPQQHLYLRKINTKLWQRHLE